MQVAALWRGGRDNLEHSHNDRVVTTFIPITLQTTHRREGGDKARMKVACKHCQNRTLGGREAKMAVLDHGICPIQLTLFWLLLKTYTFTALKEEEMRPSWIPFMQGGIQDHIRSLSHRQYSKERSPGNATTKLTEGCLGLKFCASPLLVSKTNTWNVRSREAQTTNHGFGKQMPLVADFKDADWTRRQRNWVRQREFRQTLSSTGVSPLGWGRERS